MGTITWQPEDDYFFKNNRQLWVNWWHQIRRDQDMTLWWRSYISHWWQQAFQCSTQVVAKLTQTVATAAGLPTWRLPMAYAYAQNAIPYQVLDSTFWRFDCDCFIHSMHSSMVPFGCASCHFRARCCCSKEHVSCKFFLGLKLAWYEEGSRVIIYLPIFLSMDLLTWPA